MAVNESFRNKGIIIAKFGPVNEKYGLLANITLIVSIDTTLVVITDLEIFTWPLGIKKRHGKSSRFMAEDIEFRRIGLKETVGGFIGGISNW